MGTIARNIAPSARLHDLGGKEAGNNVPPLERGLKEQWRKYTLWEDSTHVPPSGGTGIDVGSRGTGSSRLFGGSQPAPADG